MKRIIFRLAVGLIIIFLAQSLLADLAGEADSMTESAKLLIQADDLFGRRQYAEAIDVYIQAIAAAREEGDNSNLVEGLSQVARCHLAKDDKEKGRSWLLKAGEKATKTEPRGWSRYLGVRGRFEWKDEISKTGEPVPVTIKASGTFKEMYDYCLKHNLHERAVDAANMVAITGDMAERIEWGRRGINAAEKGGIDKWLGPLWNNLGWNYDDLGRFDEALEALKKARYYHYKSGDDLSKLVADWSVGQAYRKTGQLDSAMIWLSGAYNKAVENYGQDSSMVNAEWLGLSCRELGELALNKGDHEKALNYLERAKDHLFAAGMPDWDAAGFKELSEQIRDLSAEEE